MHPLLQEAAHYGPVRSIAAAEQRVWTCGGSSAFARFKEWTQFGWPLSNADMRNTGATQRRCAACVAAPFCILPAHV